MSHKTNKVAEYVHTSKITRDKHIKQNTSNNKGQNTSKQVNKAQKDEHQNHVETMRENSFWWE